MVQLSSPLVLCLGSVGGLAKEEVAVSSKIRLNEGGWLFPMRNGKVSGINSSIGLRRDW